MAVHAGRDGATHRARSTIGEGAVLVTGPSHERPLKCRVRACVRTGAASDCRVSRFAYALLAAIALHGLLLVARSRHPPQGATSFTLPIVEMAVELDEPSPIDSPPAVPRASDDPRPAMRAADPGPGAVALHASVRRTEAPHADLTSNGDAMAKGGDPVDAVGAPPSDPTTGKPEPPIDLGLDGHFFMRAPSEELPRVRKSPAQRQLEASLSANDVERGLARGGALLSSLNAAVRDTGPARGEALLLVTVGADGGVIDAEFLGGSARDWAAAVQSFRLLASHKRVRLPTGARGLRVTFSVKSKLQMPSGKAVTAPGVDVASPSLAPNGLTLHGTFDVADLGGGAQRLVYARVVSEEVL